MEFWFQLINHHLLKLTPSCRQHHRKIMAVLRFAMPAMLLTLFYKRKLERISKMFIGFVVSKSRIILLVFLDSDGWSRHWQRLVDLQDLKFLIFQNILILDFCDFVVCILSFVEKTEGGSSAWAERAQPYSHELSISLQGLGRTWMAHRLSSLLSSILCSILSL